MNALDDGRPPAAPSASPGLPALPLTFRQEIVPHVFKALRGGSSVALVGLPGVGMSNLLRFLAQPPVAAHHLGPAAGQALHVYVEADQLLNPADLHAGLARQIATAARAFNLARADLAALRRLAEARDAGLAAMLAFLCGTRERQVVFLLDEFDSPLRLLPPIVLRQLRSLRDDYKYRLAYALGLRSEPSALAAARPVADPAVEKFTELFEQHTFPLRPYTYEDTLLAIARKTVGWDPAPTTEQQDRLYGATGGHPKLLLAALAYLENRLHLPWGAIEPGLAADPGVLAACQALWAGLDAGEQSALWRLARDQRAAISPAELAHLVRRGLASGGPEFVFANLFEAFIAAQAGPAPTPESVRFTRLRDPGARIYW